MPNETFRDYCAYQIERLGGAFPEFRFYKSGAIEELVNWLDAKASGNRERASALVTEATEFSQLPSLADLSTIWFRLFPPPAVREASPDCPHCSGAGWIIVTRNGCDGADRCTCGAPPAADPTKPAKAPPRLSLAEIEQLRDENHRFAAQLAREMSGKVSKPAAPPDVTEADIAAIKAVQESRAAKRRALDELAKAEMAEGICEAKEVEA